MQINLIAIGKKMPSWVEAGYQEYAKRLPTDFKLNLIEIPAQKRGKKANIDQILQKEGEHILNTISTDQRTIALDDQGKLFTTEQLAKQLSLWQNDGRDINLLIGGPEGLAPECLKKAEMMWSLSPLTFPHPLVRVIVAEQIYRAWSLLNHHPYHRE